MKFRKILFFTCLFFSFSFANGLKEGIDYITLKEPFLDSKNSLIEVFNVSCPHCANLAEHLPLLFSVLDKEVEFKPYHISSNHKIIKETSLILAVMMILDKESNQNIKSKDSYFNRVVGYYFKTLHKENYLWKSKKELLQKSLEVAKINSKKYEEILQKNTTKALIKEWENASKYAKIQGIPALIVNGKYLILAKNVKDIEDYIYKIDTLLKK